MLLDDPGSRRSSPVQTADVQSSSFDKEKDNFISKHSPYMVGANGSVRGKKECEPSSLAAESEPLLGPHLKRTWSPET